MVENANQHLKNLMGALLLMIMSASLTLFILLPEIKTSFLKAIVSQNTMDEFFALESILTGIFLIAFPLFLIVRSLVDWFRCLHGRTVS